MMIGFILAAQRHLDRLLHALPQPATSRQKSGLRVMPIEALETRVLPANVSIQIDFSLDTNNFFDTPLKRSVMQSAADAYAARLTDNLLPIDPSGANRWNAGVNHPGTGDGINLGNIEIPANTIIVFAGGRPQSATIAAIGGPAGFSPSENHGSAEFLNAVRHRGQSGQIADPPTDFGPWGGFVSFNTATTDWFFGTTPTGIGPTDLDVYSVALHELGHVLGFGTAPSFDALISHGDFTGPKAIAAYDFGGDPPLGGGEAHWENGLTDEGQPTVMDSAAIRGVRVPLTDLDLAALDDIGWMLNGPVTGARPHVILPGSTVTFVRGDAPVQVDANALFTNPDGLSLAGAQLTASISLNQSNTDRLGLLSLNGVKLSGRTVRFNGIEIGFNTGTKGSLRIVFNAQASDQGVQAVIRNLIFSTKKKASGLDRQIRVQVSNIQGDDTAAVSKTIQLI